MRTTLDIDDDVLAVIKDVAAARKISAGKAASELIRKALAEPVSRGVSDAAQEEYILDGFPVFPSGGGKITHEQIRKLMDEED